MAEYIVYVMTAMGVCIPLYLFYKSISTDYLKENDYDLTAFVGKDKANFITHLSDELGINKKEVLKNALLSYADTLESSVIQKRLWDVKNDPSSIMSVEDFNKAVKP